MDDFIDDESTGIMTARKTLRLGPGAGVPQ